jgi:ssDNA-binding Zn-finger/Zn-ribbon topoisomerase 1
MYRKEVDLIEFKEKAMAQTDHKALFPCPACGNHNLPLEYTPNGFIKRPGEMRICPNCNTQYTLDPSGTGMIMMRDNLFLLYHMLSEEWKFY